MKGFALCVVVAACSSSAGDSTIDGGHPGDGSHSGDGSNAAVDGAISTLTPGQTTINVTAAGTARTAILYVPANATTSSQLAIALHGNGDTDTNFLATSGLKALADQDGTVMVIPQGIPRDVTVMGQTLSGIDWDAYNSAASGNIDLPFLDALRTQIVATHQVDAQHVFVFGYSQGGYLSFEYGMVTGNALSCAAVLAASSPFGGAANDPLISGAQRKLAVVLQIGTNDGAYAQTQTTEATLMSDGFPTELESIQGAGHVPIPGDVSVPWGYCRGMAL